jgi:hypothetical protein
VWTHGEEKLQEFHKIANGIHPNIQVDLRYSKEKIEFLDTYTRINTQGNLETDLFTKDTDRHLYLHRKSEHPNSVKKAVPYGLGVRLRRICQNQEDYQIHREELKTQMRRRGYTGKEVEGQLKKVDGLQREDLMKKQEKKSTTRVPMVIQYSRSLPNIHGILQNRINILHRSDRLKDVFKEPPIVAFKRGENLNDLLVHRKHNNQFRFKEYENGSKKCEGKRCSICPRVRETTSIEGPNGVVWNIINKIDCQTRNVVYGIECKTCMKLVYVGETGRKLKERVIDHLSCIRTNKNTEVATHFNSEGHRLEDIMVVGIEKVKESRCSYRRLRETLVINKLGTMEPNGLNSKQGF